MRAAPEGSGNAGWVLTLEGCSGCGFVAPRENTKSSFRVDDYLGAIVSCTIAFSSRFGLRMAVDK